jgi:hypothetical protein
MKKALDSVTLQGVADLQARKEAGATPTED